MKEELNNIRFEEDEEDYDQELDSILLIEDDNPFDEPDESVEEENLSRKNNNIIRKAMHEIVSVFGDDDHGLASAIFHANHWLTLQGESKIPTDENWLEVLSNLLSMDGLIKFYKTRRDSPLIIRSRIRTFLETIAWSESRPVQSPDVVDDYVQIALTCYRFLSRLKSQNAISIFHEYCVAAYESQKHGLKKDEFDAFMYMIGEKPTEDKLTDQVSEKPTANIVQWATDEFKIFGENKEGGSFLKRIFANRLKPRLDVNEEIFDTLQARFPHFAEVTTFYKAQFRLNMLTGRDYIPPVLLLGAPGIGKTIYAKELAQALATGYTFIDMASASASWTLSGLTSSWSGAKPGKLVMAMLESRTASPVVVLDEIEKSGTSGHGQDPRTPLYQLLEENTAKAFTDEFVDFPVDLSRIIYIACANRTDGLTEPLLTRFQIFEIADPSDDQHGIILESIYQAEVAGTLAFPAHLPHEIKVHLRGQSLRTAKVQISKAISSVLLAMNMEELRSAQPHSINLSVENFQAKQLKKKSMGF